MPKHTLSPEAAQLWQQRLSAILNKRIGISFGVEILAPEALARSEYKAKRWQDDRGHAQRPKS
jgi:hypothetical protein